MTDHLDGITKSAPTSTGRVYFHQISLKELKTKEVLEAMASEGKITF